jgi:hypothetical protein
MRDSWRRHSITVDSPGGWTFFYKIIKKSMTKKISTNPFPGKNIWDPEDNWISGYRRGRRRKGKTTGQGWEFIKESVGSLSLFSSWSLVLLLLWLCYSSFSFLGIFTQFLELLEVLILGSFAQFLFLSFRSTKGRRRRVRILGWRCRISLSKFFEIQTFCVYYYESTKRELNRRLIYECRCDERLKTKTEGSTRLTYTGLCGGLEHLKIETRLIDERFADCLVCECFYLYFIMNQENEIWRQDLYIYMSRET